MFFFDKNRVFLDRIFSLRWFKSYALIIIGAIIMSSGYSFFADPHKIVPGGVYGTAIVFHHLWDLPTGTVGLCFNIPLFLMGMWVLGPKFGVKTFIGTILTSFCMDFFNSLEIFSDSAVKGSPLDDPLLASIVAGILIGAGLALIFKAKATTGGSDIIAQVIHKYTRYPVGQLLIFLDSLVVSVGVIAFKNFSLAIYAFITIFITGKVLDGILLGGNNRKAVFIVSSKYDLIRDFVIKKLRRGGTFFYAQGMYKNDDKKVIYTAVSRRELSALQDFVKDVDSDAFISVFDTNQVYGRGFLPLDEQ